jgi:hypothetical protein
MKKPWRMSSGEAETGTVLVAPRSPELIGGGGGGIYAYVVDDTYVAVADVAVADVAVADVVDVVNAVQGVLSQFSK